MGSHFKVAVLATAVVFALLSGTATQARRSRRGRGGGGGKGRGGPGQRQWLDDVLGTDHYRALQAFNDQLLADTDLVSIGKDCNTYDLMKSCKKLFHRKVKTGQKNYQKGQSDVIQRLSTFRSLLQQALVCVRQLDGDEGALENSTQDVLNAVGHYENTLTQLCIRKDRAYKPLAENATKLTVKQFEKRNRRIKARKCGKRSSRYRCKRPIKCTRNADSTREQVKILSLQVSHFLQKLNSTQPSGVCSRPARKQRKRSQKGAGRKRPKKGKGGRKGRRDKKRKPGQKAKTKMILTTTVGSLQ